MRRWGFVLLFSTLAKHTAMWYFRKEQNICRVEPFPRSKAFAIMQGKEEFLLRTCAVQQ